jgi:hypothetical protein
MRPLDAFLERSKACPDCITSATSPETFPFDIDFSYRFHAVGQGLFASGQLSSLHIAKSFTWVFDSGTSDNQFFIQREIALLRSGLMDRPIDLLCISHFDKDHISGIKVLLSQHRVRAIVMPYISLVERMRIAIGDEATSGAGIDADHLLFLVDPAGYLWRICGEGTRIYVVVGSGLPPADTPHRSSSSGLGDPGLPTMELVPPLTLPHSGMSVEDLRGVRAGGTNVEIPIVVSHNSPFEIDRVWEFLFYNRPEPSMEKLEDLRKGVVDILHSHVRPGALYDGNAMIEELKEKYCGVFGASAEQKNDISLVAYCGPMKQSNQHAASLNCKVSPVADAVGHWAWHSLGEQLASGNAKIGLGYFGDFSLAGGRLASVRAHMGDERWSQMEIVQIPHHGSARSWPSNTAGKFDHHFSVISARRCSKTHPSERVLEELSGRGVVMVNEYQRALFTGEITVHLQARARR